MAKNMTRRAFPRGGVRTRLPVTIYRRASNQLHPEAQDWIDRVVANGGTVSSATAAAVNQFCADIDAAGIRDRFYRMSLFCGNSDASLAAVRTPLFRGPSLGGTQYGNTTDDNNNFLAADYAENSGLKGDGSTKYLDTGLQQASIPSLSSSHISASFTELESGAAERTIVGVWNGTASEFSVLRREGVGSRTIYQGSFQPATAAEATAEAHVLGSRPSSVLINLYRSGSLAGTGSFSATPTTTTKTYYIYARNNADGVATTLTAMRLRMYSIGTAIDGADAVAFSNAVAAFNSAMGRA
jgi:hypothetical protein